MTSRQKLLSTRTDARAVILASELWEASYRRDPVTFKKLIRQAASLETDLAEYFVSAAPRVARRLNWNELPAPSFRASVVPPKTDLLWNDEEKYLYSVVVPYIIEMMGLGAQAGETIYKTPLGLTTLDSYILDSAHKHTADLVSGLTETTRNQVRKAIQISIAQGEDITAATNRLIDVVSSPVRAEMIAATESVNAYQSGLQRFGKASGAVSKTWDYLAGACQICQSVVELNPDGTVDIDDDFQSSIGPLQRPAAHTRCRCGVIYNYS